jgi:hypothetical protein
MKGQRLLLMVTLLNSVGLVIMFAGMRTAVAQGVVPVLRAGSLEIVDDHGRVRASLSVLPAGTSAHGDS